MSRGKDVMSSPSCRGVFSVEGSRGSWAVLHEGEILADGFTRKADAEERKKFFADEWKKSHWSDTAWGYMSTLVAEIWTGQPSQNFTSTATDWGEENEPAAFEAALPKLARTFGQRLTVPDDEFAFIEHPDEPGIGCSPDGIIGDNGLLEIKCPFNASKWVRRKFAGLTVPSEYVPQVQGSLWVTGRKWYAFAYYDGRMQNAGLDPLLITKVERDDDYIDNVLAPRIIAFRDWVQEMATKYVEEPF